MTCRQAGVVLLLLTTMNVFSDSFLYPDEKSNASKRKFADRDANETQGNNETESWRNLEKTASASREMKRREAGNWKELRQFNSALGMGIDTPASQPQTNAYDIHNIQDDDAPWQSSDANDAYYVYYYYPDEDIPLPERKSRRSRMLTPDARRHSSAAADRAHHRVTGGRRRQQQARDRRTEMKSRFGRPSSFTKWTKKKVQN